MSRFTEDTVRPTIRVIIEEGPTSWGAFVPSVPGCVAAGTSRADVIRLVEQGLTTLFDVQHEEHAAEDLALAEEAVQTEARMQSA